MRCLLFIVAIFSVEALASPKPIPTLLTEPMILKKYDAYQLQSFVQGLSVAPWCNVNVEESNRFLLTLRPLYEQKVKEELKRITWIRARRQVESCESDCRCGLYLFLFEKRTDIPKDKLKRLQEKSQKAQNNDIVECVKKRTSLCHDVLLPSLRSLSADPK